MADWKNMENDIEPFAKYEKWDGRAQAIRDKVEECTCFLCGGADANRLFHLFRDRSSSYYPIPSSGSQTL
jgi:hypothetical protein